MRISLISRPARRPWLRDYPHGVRSRRDNYLYDAIQASAFPSRHGTADCSSYFLTTVTPATSTSTITSTIYTPVTAVQDITAVQTLESTASTTVDITLIETSDITLTTTFTTDVTTVTSIGTILISVFDRGLDPRHAAALTPRQATVAPSRPLLYQGSTTTLATPVATKTVLVTSPSTFSTQTTTDSTFVVITTDSTSVFLTTDATAIETIIDSTSTFLTIDAAATVTITDSTSIFITAIATETDTMSATVTSVFPEATYYPQCGTSNLLEPYDGYGIIQIVAFTSFNIADESTAYSCCVKCITTSGCAAAIYAASINQCYLVGDGGTCSASNQVGVFNTATSEAANAGIIFANGPCGELG
ncbi:MAG: hypothetical protein MMC33_010732 [Icmadophila ericetorum]|nr:hypothetical protein [Icmadophila ericetorum]